MSDKLEYHNDDEILHRAMDRAYKHMMFREEGPCEGWFEVDVVQQSIHEAVNPIKKWLECAIGAYEQGDITTGRGCLKHAIEIIEGWELE